MAQRSHVPKFGNWESDNIPYTTYFENARKERGSGVKMNPNDPEENPEAFMFGIGGSESTIGVFHAVQAPFRVSSEKLISAEKHHIDEHPNSEQGHMGHIARGKNTYDQQKSGSHKSINSESGSDRSNSDNMQPNHSRARSDQKKSLVESSNSFSPSLPGPTRLRSGNHTSNDVHHRAASVPKFGAWDETDPKSGEGFTVIFNRVKEEKQIGAAKFPTVPPPPSLYSNSQKKHGSSSSGSKICCCLFSSGSK